MMQIRLQKSDYMHSLNFLFCNERGDKFFVVKPTLFTFEESSKNEALEPTFTTPIEVGQQLMDALYSQGFRPTDAKPQDETINALCAHKDELSSILNKFLKRFIER